MAIIQCPECRKDVSEQATACIHCGYPLKRGSDKKELQGVGGWLLFFIVFMLVLLPLVTWTAGIGEIAGIERNMPQLAAVSGWGDFKNATYLILTGVIIYSLVIAFLLVKRKTPKTVYHTIAAVWICGPGASLLLGIVVPLAILGNYSFDNVFGHLVRGGIGGIIWTLYFLKSQRVKNTYGL